MSEHIPLPGSNLILVDLDGTLVNDKYEATDKGINGAVDRLQRKKWLIGLSSDTPYEPLAGWRKEFGMNGPLIAEKGAVVELKNGLHYDKELVKPFARAKEDIQEHLTGQGISVWTGDPVAALRKGRLDLKNMGEIVVLLNGLRRCSLGLIIREKRGGKLHVSKSATNMVIRETERFYPDDFALTVDHTDSSVIVHRKRTNKRTGTQKLLKDMGVGRCIMIGNSAPDFVGKDLAVHCAVGNATDSFARRADYTATGRHTDGVIEILDQIYRSTAG